MRSAPASSTASTSSPSRAKSADRIDGAIHAGSMGTVYPTPIRLCLRASLTGETRQGFTVLFAGARDHLRGQLRTRRLLVPVERFQVVAHELLVEAGRADPYTVAVRGPKAR